MVAERQSDPELSVLGLHVHEAVNGFLCGEK